MKRYVIMYLSKISLYEEQTAIFSGFSNLNNESNLVVPCAVLLVLFVLLSCAHPIFTRKISPYVSLFFLCTFSINLTFMFHTIFKILFDHTKFPQLNMTHSFCSHRYILFICNFSSPYSVFVF